MPRCSALKTKYRKRDLDQIYEDLKPENASKRLREATEIDEEKPALGQHYCLSCGKYFCDKSALETHTKGKPHKRRMRNLESEPHCQEIADWAAGVGSRKLESEHSPGGTRPLKAALRVDEPSLPSTD
ncbi:putative zinc finger protein [Echinococcus granulosus]|uniref:Zinc finger C2H2 type n=1 Tax=Echinococcus granulosus TaxID=6210 RepID=U6IUB1_ECHGR|nr:Zinc finger protein [Echinococcus granulosus]EUB65058.1 Zinc finger protein [Echinococcus granulosus]KAH9286128.1 putative zinc finger protein [Echinococcus granulosus]CDS15382.1 zinc finger C2H2 type [Echinococcus granulosus]